MRIRHASRYGVPCRSAVVGWQEILLESRATGPPPPARPGPRGTETREDGGYFVK